MRPNLFMNEEIKSEVTYTIEDFERQFVYMKNRNIFLKYIIFLPIIFFSVILLFFYILDPNKFSAAFSQPKNYMVFVIAFLIVGIWWFFRRNKMSFFQKRTIIKQLNTTPALSAPQIITFDDTGMYGENEFASGLLKWNAMVEVTETENDFYFFKSPKFAQFAPKRFFSDEQIARIRELARKHLGEKAKF